jgi:hypothetical protein
MSRRERRSDDFLCPHCGGRLAKGASFCRHCGADEESGWSDDGDGYDAAPGDDDFDYHEYLAREFPESTPVRFSLTRWLIVLLVAALCLGLVLATL